MLTDFQNYLTFENIYLYSNIGVLPFWIILLFFPNSKIYQLLINAIIVPLLLSSAYIYVVYQAILLDENIFDIFKLYLSLDYLYTIFANETFLLVFWLHFLAVNIFLGSWVAREGVKYNMSRRLVFVPLVFVYFSGPVGLVFFWLIRIFYAKKIGLYD